MDPVSTIPFHLAKVYGLERVARVTKPAPVSRKPIDPITSAPSERTQAGESLRLFHPQGGSKANPQVAQLIAAKVPGGVDFSSGDPQPRTGSLALYHHPADRNAAATGVDLGRMLDATA